MKACLCCAFQVPQHTTVSGLPYRVTVPCTPCSYCQGRSLRRRLNHCLLQCLLNYTSSAVSSVLVVQDEAIYLEIIDFCWVLIFWDFMY